MYPTIWQSILAGIPAVPSTATPGHQHDNREAGGSIMPPAASFICPVRSCSIGQADQRQVLGHLRSYHEVPLTPDDGSDWRVLRNTHMREFRAWLRANGFPAEDALSVNEWPGFRTFRSSNGGVGRRNSDDETVTTDLVTLGDKHRRSRVETVEQDPDIYDPGSTDDEDDSIEVRNMKRSLCPVPGCSTVRVRRPDILRHMRSEHDVPLTKAPAVPWKTLRHIHGKEYAAWLKNGGYLVDIRFFASNGLDDASFASLEEAPHGQQEDFHANSIEHMSNERKNKRIDNVPSFLCPVPGCSHFAIARCEVFRHLRRHHHVPLSTRTVGAKELSDRRAAREFARWQAKNGYEPDVSFFVGREIELSDVATYADCSKDEDERILFESHSNDTALGDTETPPIIESKAQKTMCPVPVCGTLFAGRKQVLRHLRNQYKVPLSSGKPQTWVANRKIHGKEFRSWLERNGYAVDVTFFTNDSTELDEEMAADSVIAVDSITTAGSVIDDQEQGLGAGTDKLVANKRGTEPMELDGDVDVTGTLGDDESYVASKSYIDFLRHQCIDFVDLQTREARGLDFELEYFAVLVCAWNDPAWKRWDAFCLPQTWGKRNLQGLKRIVVNMVAYWCKAIMERGERKHVVDVLIEVLGEAFSRNGVESGSA
ncbi:hypothetical protein LTR62_007041 [Meristemomyces frigidus]|uniref:C2H2-type domain-containing protein n=1 Tax=Meristemomyces frigidus TaxID=1508187 RepID=A0AAN7YP81_9PEZI|nr:hypothetical protein LTR62_007041 [Meristemomyces frigidus]